MMLMMFLGMAPENTNVRVVTKLVMPFKCFQFSCFERFYLSTVQPLSYPVLRYSVMVPNVEDNILVDSPVELEATRISITKKCALQSKRKRRFLQLLGLENIASVIRFLNLSLYYDNI